MQGTAAAGEDIVSNLWQITAPHFCAGVIERGGMIVEAAPILRWAVGQPYLKLGVYCKRKGWKMVIVP